MGRWADEGVLASTLDVDSVRFVAHFQVGNADISRALKVITGA